MNIISTIKQRYYQVGQHFRDNQRLKALRRDLREAPDIVLVHQMGRAASMTITNTLRSLDLHMPIYHTHWLNPATVADRVRANRAQGMFNLSFNVRVSEEISPAIERNVASHRWHVITVARDPVARNLSAYFLSIERFFPGFVGRFNRGLITLPQIRDSFLQHYRHEIPMQWFDSEVRDVFKIDIFQSSFPQEVGYQIIESGPVRLLILKLEWLRDVYADAFSAFLGQRPASLRDTHVTDRDPTMSMYRDFVATVGLPPDYVDGIYSSNYARHFYSPSELETFRLRWVKSG